MLDDIVDHVIVKADRKVHMRCIGERLEMRQLGPRVSEHRVLTDDIDGLDERVVRAADKVNGNVNLVKVASNVRRSRGLVGLAITFCAVIVGLNM